MRIIFALLLVLQYLLFVVGQTENMPEGRTPEPERTPSPLELATPAPGETVYEVISRIPELSELVDLADRTGFRFFLDSPYSRVTLFAPTNEAFQMFRGGDQQQDQENFDREVQIMVYHIGTPARSVDVFQDNELFFTSGGLPVRINRYEDLMFVTVNGALVQGDLRATNGEIIILDQVLTPPNATLYETIQRREDFSMFAQLVQDAGQDIIDRLNDPSASLTVLVPTNQAFEGEDQMGQENPADFVRRFISDQVLYSIALYDGRTVETESGESLQVNIEGNSLLLGDAMIREVDINAVNGVAHALNEFPRMATSMPETPQSQ